MREKVIITDSQKDINDFLDNGWRVKFVVSGHVSTSNGGQVYLTTEMYGKFCFILERE